MLITVLQVTSTWNLSVFLLSSLKNINTLKLFNQCYIHCLLNSFFTDLEYNFYFSETIKNIQSK